MLFQLKGEFGLNQTSNIGRACDSQLNDTDQRFQLFLPLVGWWSLIVRKLLEVLVPSVGLYQEFVLYVLKYMYVIVSVTMPFDHPVDPHTESVAHYRLGNVFQAVGKYEKALEVRLA